MGNVKNCPNSSRFSVEFRNKFSWQDIIEVLKMYRGYSSVALHELFDWQRDEMMELCEKRKNARRYSVK